MSLTCVRGCTVARRHLADCPCADPQHEHGTFTVPAEQIPGYGPDWPADVEGMEVACGCPGCLPKLAAPRLAVCWTCRNRAERDLTELPGLWADLAERPRLSGVSKAPDSEGDSPADPMTDKRRHARSAIKAMLVTWCITLAEDHSITVPDEAEIARTSRNIAAWYSDQAAQAQQAVRLLEMPTVGPLVRDPEGAQALRVHVKQHAAEAAKVRDDRETGRDILTALAAHIGRHLDTLLADLEHADQLCADLANAASEARRCAYPTRGPATRILCTCGQRVTLNSEDPTTDIACRGCGEHGVLAWWIDTHKTIPDGPQTLVDLKDWLLTAHHLDVPLETLRTWTKRVPPEAEAPMLPSVGRDEKGRRLFDSLAGLALARKMQDRRRHAIHAA